MKEKELESVIASIKSPECPTEICKAGHHINDEQACKIADALRQNTRVESLRLNSNRIGPKGAQALADMLLHNTTLRIFDIGGNKIHSEGAKAFAEVSQNIAVQFLGLGQNFIGDEGVKALAKALHQNTSVQTLELNANDIGDDGVKALIELLDQNFTIQFLVLKFNINISLHMLSRLLRQNKLQSLNISSILVENKDLKIQLRTLVEALEKNYTLQTLTLASAFTKIDVEDQAEIDKILARNKAYQERIVPYWADIAFVIAFIRANKGSELRYSCLALVPLIQKCCDFRPSFLPSYQHSSTSPSVEPASAFSAITHRLERPNP